MSNRRIVTTTIQLYPTKRGTVVIGTAGLLKDGFFLGEKPVRDLVPRSQEVTDDTLYREYLKRIYTMHMEQRIDLGKWQES